MFGALMLTTLPNLLTLARIAAVPLVVAMFYCPTPSAPYIACGLFTVAGITDWLDGHLARRWEQQSELGRFLDPIADKLLVAAVLFMLVAKDRISSVTILPALVILMREILVSGLREHLAGLRVSVPVSWLAKWKTGIQMVAIGVLLVGDYGPSAIPVRAIGEILLWLAAALTIRTGYDYLRAGLIHIDGSGIGPAAPPSAEPHSPI
jgi:cardiolipin synthase